MSGFSERVSNYPLVSDSLKAASDAYNWVTSGDRFRTIFQLTENAAAALKEKAASLANTGILQEYHSIFQIVKIKLSSEFDHTNFFIFNRCCSQT